MDTKRKFGVELEVVGLSHGRLEDALNTGGVNARAESYNHNVRRHWKIVADGSLRAVDGHSGEVVSPPTHSIDEVRRACSLLSRAGAKVNRSCGLHVHFDASDFGDSSENILEWRILLAAYAMAEGDIDSWMPVSRRASNNTFCKSLLMSGYMLQTGAQLVGALWQRSTLSGLSDSMYACDRYRKVNLQSFVRYGTVEFRQHGGTLSPDKVTNWILFLESLMSFAKAMALKVRSGLMTEESLKSKLAAGVWYERGLRTHGLFSSLSASYQHHPTVAPVGAAVTPDRDGDGIAMPLGGTQRSPEWRASLDATRFCPVSLVLRDPSGQRARAITVLNENFQAPWTTLVSMLVDQVGMTPGNANAIFARWNRALIAREERAAAPRVARRRATPIAATAYPLIEYVAPQWSDIGAFYEERAMELSSAGAPL